MIEVTLFSRSDCHLCEQANADLEALQDQYPHRLVVVDVDSSLELQRKYGFEVPVVKVGPYTLKAPFGQTELAMTLSATLDREAHIERSDNAPGLSRTWGKADSLALWFSRHYMAVFNLFVLVYFGLPVLAPFLMASGYEGPARLIYRGYGMVCHQLSYRSFFVLGEQVVYPRAAADVEGLTTFGGASGLSEENTVDAIYAARNFIGNSQMGYKIALCERDIAIYGAILVFGLLFVLSGRKLPPLHWSLWILIGLVPVGLDGFSQLLSQPPFNFFPYRESTPFLRTLTGFLFGFATAWFGYPMVEVTMADSRQIMEDKLRRIKSELPGEEPLLYQQPDRFAD